MKLRCLFGFHKWYYSTGNRECELCKIRQILKYDRTHDGMLWEDV